MTWEQLGSTYDRVASKYDERFRDELDGKPRDRELLEHLAASVVDPVLEIGSGPGHVGAFVRACGRRVVGLDLSVEMAALANRRLDAAVAADMRSLPVASGTVGAAVAFYSIIHLRRDEVRAVLREFRRVLRPDGRVLFSAHEGEGEVERDEFLDEHVPFVATLFTLDELATATNDAGFDITLAERRPSYETESGTVRLYVEGIRRPRR